jgi:3'-5' exoribonuclease 1
MPDYATHWINLRKVFANFYKGSSNGDGAAASTRLPGLQAMLSTLGLEFEGQPHSGLDDAKNIARVVGR